MPDANKQKPSVIGEARPDKMVTQTAVLGSGKNAAISVPVDFDDADLPYMMKFILDIWMHMKVAREQGQDKGGAIQIARSLPPTSDSN